MPEVSRRSAGVAVALAFVVATVGLVVALSVSRDSVGANADAGYAVIMEVVAIAAVICLRSHLQAALSLSAVIVVCYVVALINVLGV